LRCGAIGVESERGCGKRPPEEAKPSSRRTSKGDNVAASARAEPAMGFPALVARRHLDLLVLWSPPCRARILCGTCRRSLDRADPHSPLHRSLFFTATAACSMPSGCRHHLLHWSRLFSTAGLVWWKWGMLVRHLRLLFRLLRQICGVQEAPIWPRWPPLPSGRPSSTCGLSSTPSSAISLISLSRCPCRAGCGSCPRLMLWRTCTVVSCSPLTIATCWRFRSSTAKLPDERYTWPGLLLACFVNGNGSEALLWPIRFARTVARPFYV